MSEEHARLLGEINGKLSMVIATQQASASVLEALDTRLRKVETRSAVAGAVCGGFVSVGIALMIEKGKHIIGA